MKEFIGFCDMKKGFRKKCNGYIIRVKKSGNDWVQGMEGVSHIEYCLKCLQVHMLWNKGDLEKIKKDLDSKSGGQE